LLPRRAAAPPLPLTLPSATPAAPQACLAQGGAVPEAEHLVRADTSGGSGGPELGRAHRLANGAGPLAGLRLQLAGPYSGAKDELSALLREAGAALVARLPPPSAPAAEREGLHVLVDVEVAKGQVGLLTGAALQLGVPAVSHKWALACISCFKLLPTEGYAVAAGR
jgi:hypothetical protein